MTENEITEKLTKVEERCKSNTHRLDKVEKTQEDIGKLVTSIALVAQRQDNMDKNIGDIKTKVEVLTGKSGKRWDSIVEKVLLLVVAAVVGYCLTKIGLQ